MVFVSYSSKDRDFVDRLSARLVRRKVHVWLDRWELRAGESLIERIQAAVSESDYLLVVLSKNSVDSAWCKKELHTAMVRELDEKRVVIVPLVLDDAPVPAFLREKLYVDFRKDFDEGVDQVCEAVAAGTNDTLFRLEMGRYLNDIGIDWGVHQGRVTAHLDIVSFSQEEQHSVLVQITMIGNARVTRRFLKLASAGHRHAAMSEILEECSLLEHHEGLEVIMPDNRIVHNSFKYGIRETGKEYEVHVRCRRLGNDNGKSLLYHVGKVFAQAREMNLSRRERIPPGRTPRKPVVVESIKGAPRKRSTGAKRSPPKSAPSKSKRRRT